jgi:hypothetical protein
MDALGIISVHADGCADDLDALSRGDSGDGAIGQPPRE